MMVQHVRCLRVCAKRMLMLWSHNMPLALESEITDRTIVCVVGLAQRRARAAAMATALLLSLSALLSAVAPADTDDLEAIVKRAQAYRRTFEGWRTVRQLDCARCHGANYRGSVG